MISIKTKYNDEIRRFSISSNTKLQELKLLLQRLYERIPSNCFLQYSVRGLNNINLSEINSNSDFEKAIHQTTSSNSKLLFITISEPQLGNNIPITSNSSSLDLFNAFGIMLQQFVSLSVTNNNQSQKEKEDCTDQLCEQLHSLVLEEMPEKQEILKKFNLAQGNSNEPASDIERRSNYKKLLGGPMPYTQLTESGVKDPNEHVKQQVKKKRPVFRKSCPDCEEPMDKEDGEYVCNNFECT